MSSTERVTGKKAAAYLRDVHGLRICSTVRELAVEAGKRGDHDWPAFQARLDVYAKETKARRRKTVRAVKDPCATGDRMAITDLRSLARQRRIPNLGAIADDRAALRDALFKESGMQPDEEEKKREEEDDVDLQPEKKSEDEDEDMPKIAAVPMRGTRRHAPRKREPAILAAPPPIPTAIATIQPPTETDRDSKLPLIDGHPSRIKREMPLSGVSTPLPVFWTRPITLMPSGRPVTMSSDGISSDPFRKLKQDVPVAGSFPPALWSGEV